MEVLVKTVLVATALAAALSAGDSRSGNSTDRATIRLDSNLVLVPVTVTDSRGRLIPDLVKSDFTVLDDGNPQQVQSFSREDAPVSLGIVVDSSGSMGNKVGKIITALRSFLDNLEPEDEEFLVTFADTPALRLPFTSDPVAVQNSLFQFVPRGSTALFDAVAMAVRQMHWAHNQRKVLFLVSDGGDNHSRVTERALLRNLEEEDVQIHAIGIHDGMAAMEEKRGPWVLEDLAKTTGGQHYMIRDAAELPALAARISLSLHNRYLLGYSPTPAGRSGGFRRIVVKVKAQQNAQKTYVFARRGYWMP